jgi:hypothetical protein
MIMRGMAVVAGVLVIAATAHVGITATGGYAEIGAPLKLAVAVGLVVGSVCVGLAWRERRWIIVGCLVLTLLAGEAFQVIMTAERIVTGREAQQAKLRDADAVHAKAAERVTAAQAALAAVPTDTARLKAAIDAQVAAAATVREKSAERGCATNCRALLQAQVDAAQTEVAAARAEAASEIAKARAGAEAELQDAQAALAAVKVPPSATPLADRLGIAGWALDLLTAALASIAANGLGAALVAFGSHGRSERHAGGATPRPPVVHTAPVAATSTPLKALPSPARDHAARFGVAMLRPAKGSVPVLHLHSAYNSWCEANAVEALPAREIATALDDLFARNGLVVREIDGAPHLVGARLKQVPRRKALGEMTTVGATS